MSEKYDLVVIGGGPGGLAAAEAAATRRVLIVDLNGWGGTCTHRGCIPTKALLYCSKSYTGLKKLKRLGVNVAGATFDFTGMKKHQQSMIKIAELGAQKMLADARVEMQKARAEILSPREVRLSDSSGLNRTVVADNIVIAWGAETQLPPGINLSSKILTSDSILGLAELPESMIIVGGSFIGVEYATLFAELGVKIILLELLEGILPAEDEEAVELVGQELTRLGIVVHTSTKITALRENENSVVLQALQGGKVLEMRAGCALLCTGRKPLLDRVQLDRLGVQYSSAGIRVNENMRTSVPSVYAAGDVTGGMMLAHRASCQGRAAVAHMLGRKDHVYQEENIPSVLYSHPPVARVGYTQKRAAAAGLTVEVVKSSYGASIMARTELLGQGFVKVVFSEDRIIGATIAGDGAAELIVPVALAVSCRLTKKQLGNWVIPHPTLGEIFLPLVH